MKVIGITGGVRAGYIEQTLSDEKWKEYNLNSYDVEKLIIESGRNISDYTIDQLIEFGITEGKRFC